MYLCVVQSLSLYASISDIHINECIHACSVQGPRPGRPRQVRTTVEVRERATPACHEASMTSCRQSSGQCRVRAPSQERREPTERKRRASRRRCTSRSPRVRLLERCPHAHPSHTLSLHTGSSPLRTHCHWDSATHRHAARANASERRRTLQSIEMHGGRRGRPRHSGQTVAPSLTELREGGGHHSAAHCAAGPPPGPALARLVDGGSRGVSHALMDMERHHAMRKATQAPSDWSFGSRRLQPHDGGGARPASAPNQR